MTKARHGDQQVIICKANKFVFYLAPNGQFSLNAMPSAFTLNTLTTFSSSHACLQNYNINDKKIDFHILHKFNKKKLLRRPEIQIS